MFLGLVTDRKLQLIHLKKRRIDQDISVANAGRSRNEQESEWEEIGEGLDLPVEAFRFTPRHGPGVLVSLYFGVIIMLCMPGIMVL